MDPVFNDTRQDQIEIENHKTFTGLPGIFLGFTVGAMAALILDPRNGRRRRAYIRDQFVGRSNDLRDWGDRFTKDIGNRLWGFYREMAYPPLENVDDETLINRVRSEFGRHVSHSKSIHTEAASGVVTLSGPILASEVQDVIRTVRRVPGVKRVINRLDVRSHADHVSGLQGKGPEYLQ